MPQAAAPEAPTASRPDSTPPRHLTVRRGLEAAAAALLLFAVARWGWAAVQILAYPFEWSSMDGYYVSYAQQMLDGTPIYSEPFAAPMPFQYVPGYLLLLGTLNAVFGPAVWVDRAVALLCTLAMAALAGHVVRRRTGSVPWGLLAVGLCVAPPVVGEWYLVRGHDTFVWCVGLGATALLAEPRKVTVRLVLAAVALYVLAFFCKQTVLFPWAAGAAIVFVRERRLTPLFIVVTLGLGVGLGLGIQAWSGGWFWRNAFGTWSRHPYLPRLLLILFAGFAAGTIGILGPPVAPLLARPRTTLRHPWGLYWGACVASMALAGKFGAGPGYFVPAYVASVIWGCQLAPGWLAALGPASGRRLLVAGLALAQAAVWTRLPLRVPTEESATHAAQLLEAIRVRPGRILTERADSFATLAGRQVEWNAPHVPLQANLEHWAMEPLLADLREQRYAAVLYCGQYFQGIYWLRRTIFTYYEPAPDLEGLPLSLFYGEQTYWLLVPKPPEKLPAEPLRPPAGGGGTPGQA